MVLMSFPQGLKIFWKLYVTSLRMKSLRKKSQKESLRNKSLRMKLRKEEGLKRRRVLGKTDLLCLCLQMMRKRILRSSPRPGN